MNILGYDAVVEPLKPSLGGGYIGYIPALKGCISDGATVDQTIANLYDAAHGWLEVASELGQAVPERQHVRISA